MKKTLYLFNAGVSKILAVADDWDDQAGWCGDCNRDVDEVAVDHIIAIDDGVDDWLLLESLGSGTHEGAHEAKLDVVLLCEDLTHFLADVHEATHVDLVEGSEHGRGVLGLLQSLSDSQAHARHWDTCLSA